MDTITERYDKLLAMIYTLPKDEATDLLLILGGFVEGWDICIVSIVQAMQDGLTEEFLSLLQRDGVGAFPCPALPALKAVQEYLEVSTQQTKVHD